ncbi:hypothetical protein MMC24_003151 [Lignoscripta atroalba]|nr:hypothetical protein [Lignoscripta atroalba]
MGSPLPPDPYKILNVDKDAPLATIRSAHRKLVLTCHPDKCPDESVKAQKADQFHQVQQAYEILSDDTRRQRYDERVRLAELRAELMAGEGRPRMRGTEFVSRAATAPAFEPLYEERAPRMSYEDDYVSARYDEPRSAKKYDERYDPQASFTRRHSGRSQEDKRKIREYEDDRERIRILKEGQRSAQSDRRKSREKGRKKDYDSKYVPQAAYMEDETESDDSDSTERYVSSKREVEAKRRHEEVRKREREELPRRSSKRGDLEYANDFVDKYHNHEFSARDYIAKSQGKTTIELDSRRPANHRTISSMDTRHTAPVPPPPPPIPVEIPRRSSASGHSRGAKTSSRPRSFEKDRRGPEIVEASSSRGYEPSSRKPSIPTATSAPANLKIPANAPRGGLFSRSATMQASVEQKSQHPHPPIRRADTSPLVGMTSSRPTLQKSKLRNSEIHDSGYSSPGTPEIYATPSPQLRSSTKYQIVSDDEEDLGGPRTVLVEPEEMYPRDRDSPKSRQTHERPSMQTRGSSSARKQPSRSASYAQYAEALPSPRQPPPFLRTDSGRPPPVSRPSNRPLYGEVLTSEPLKVRHFSPKIEFDDVSYTRRGSVDSGRDAYAYESRRHPGFGRSDSYARQDIPIH